MTIYDVGNVLVGGNLEEGQRELGQAVNKILNTGSIPIIFGGGHETAYGHYLGVRSYIGDSSSIGIINIDAHFDMRDEEIATSGTMFKQILEQDPKTGYLVIGIQSLGNTKKLFATAKKFKTEYLLVEELDDFQKSVAKIQEFTKRYDYLLLTLCFDSIDSSYAPGVSAPSPFGLHPKTVKNLLRMFAKMNHLLSFDISEVNPDTDENGKTAKLAALLTAEFLNAKFLK